MKFLNAVLALNVVGGSVVMAQSATAQTPPEVVDSYPKQILKKRADERRKAAEAAKLNAQPVPTGVVTQGSSPMGIEMVVVNAGSGKLGSPDYEKKRSRFENPLRDTHINYAFEISKYEITFDDWAKCTSDGGCGGYKPDDKEWGRGKRPVINISYDDTQNFLSWLNGKTGETYRLLSEAEWEYAARAGQADAPFGNGYEITSKLANFDGKAPYGSGEKGSYLRKTQPVGKYSANAFGIHDMHGNVYEWVEDCWNKDHSGAIGDGSPRTDGDCKFRVMKGGSWVTHGYQMRAAARVRYVTDYRYDDYGIRIARTLN
jgi:formylglycine-generating enzyme required for sulfatase activity